jgi:hypothetical protein
MGNSLNPPVVVTRPMLLRALVNHNAPSGPVVMPVGRLPGEGIGNSLTLPDVVIRPIRPDLAQVRIPVP